MPLSDVSNVVAKLSMVSERSRSYIFLTGIHSSVLTHPFEYADDRFFLIEILVILRIVGVSFFYAADPF